MDDLQRRMFFEVHRDLPREGPGDRASTLRALDAALAAPGALDPVDVLDVGCGPGMQTLHLAARLTTARIVAVDLHQPFLAALADRAGDAGVTDRVTPVRADMARLPLAPQRFDLVWCEGAAYIVGVAQALESWWDLLRPGGVCAYTDAVWLKAEAPAAVRRFWQAYPAMGDIDASRARLRENGWELLSDFVLPPAAWWDDYYRPMSERLDRLAQRHRDDPAAQAALADCRAEIELYQRYGDWYGYAFFVARKPRGG